MSYPFSLPPLGFAYNALEPHIDVSTMYIHYNMHHNGYTNNLNAELANHPNLQNQSVKNY